MFLLSLVFLFVIKLRFPESKSIKNITAEMEAEWRAKHRMQEDDFSLLEVTVLRGVPHKAGRQWNFAGAFYYATNVLTTIGE